MKHIFRGLPLGMMLASASLSTFATNPIVIEAENFTATGGAYSGFSTYSIGSTGAINFNQSGDWGSYSAELPQTGTYKISLFAGTPINNTNAKILISGQELIAPVTASGAWDTFTEVVIAQEVSLVAGSNGFQLSSFGSPNTWEWNADRIVFTPLDTENEAPVATNSFGVGNVFSTTPIQVDVLENDSDANGDALYVKSVEGLVAAQYGTVTFTASGVSYLANSPAFVGHDSFSYTISDGELTATALVGITVRPTQPQPETGAPIAMADTTNTVEGESVVIPALQNDWDPNNDDIHISFVGGAGAPLNGTTTYTNSTITYTPNSGFYGSDSFTYSITDGSQSGISTVSVTVTPLNNTSPIAENDYAPVWALNPSPVTINVLDNDTDVNGDALRIVSVEGVANAQGGTVSFTDTSVIYTPVNFHTLGSDSFTYTISDGAETSTALVGLYYQPLYSPAEDGPFAQDDAVNTLQGESVVIDPLVNDFDRKDKDIWVSSVGAPAPAQNGTVSFTGSTISYTPNEGFVGTDSFSYNISNGETGGIGFVSVTVDVASY